LLLVQNVQNKMGLFVQGLTDILSIKTLQKGKDAFHNAGHYQWRDGRRPSQKMIIVHDYTIVASPNPSVFG
ncbi:hypothetical protein, partial [Alkalicoccus luteus]|uniref:hypothetical protein n=1 Tax=Alkalicoccus luteus TaxID=1237094 RepID=UPI00197BCCFB